MNRIAMLSLLFASSFSYAAEKDVARDPKADSKTGAKMELKEPVIGFKEVAFTGIVTLLEREPTHTFRLKKDTAYGVNLSSPGFFTDVRVADSEGGEVHKSGTGFASFRAKDDGVFKATIKGTGGNSGNYTFTIHELPPPKVSPDGTFVVGKEGVFLQDTIKKEDAIDKPRKRPAKTFDVRMDAGKTYVIDLISKNFDAFLRLEDAKGKQLATNDDGGDGLNSRIRFQCKTEGVYRVIAGTFGGSQTGAFLLKIREE